jgi:hypothetical protein
MFSSAERCRGLGLLLVDPSQSIILFSFKYGFVFGILGYPFLAYHEAGTWPLVEFEPLLFQREAFKFFVRLVDCEYHLGPFHFYLL